MRKTTLKKAVSLMLAAVMMFGLLPMLPQTVSAADYVVGDTETVGGKTETISLEPGTATVTDTTSSVAYVYVLTNSLTAGGEYLIVSSGSAGTRYALNNDSDGTYSAPSVTVISGDADGDGDTDTYIADSDVGSTMVWTVENGYTFKNGSYYLSYSTNNYGGFGGGASLALSTTSTNWTYNNSNSRLYISVGSNWNSRNYYLRYNNGWSLSTSSNNVYFYQKTAITTTVSVSGTYSIAGNPAKVSAVVEGAGTVTLGSTLTFTPESGSAAVTDTSTTATYTKVDGGDPNNVISAISGNTISLTGNIGTALVKVSYTGTTVAGTSYTVDNYVLITTSEPYYTVDVTHDGDATHDTDTTDDSSVTDPIVIKGIVANQKYDLNAVVSKVDQNGSSTVSEPALTWQILSDPDDAAASIDENGTITFNGTDGTVQVAVYYKVDEHTTVSDIVTISVMQSQYTIPEDGTNDFPDYPNEGSVRIDKTATAVGNFSETGMAMVEISMSGVPYSTGSEVDVVMMMDMTGSMKDDAMAAAEEAAIVFAETIVKNEDGTYNDNRVAVLAFNSGSSSPYTLWELGVITADTWDSFCTAVRTASDKQASGGTPYDEALEECNDVLTAARTDGIGDDRQQFCVFMSDGGPTSYEYITNYDAVKAGTATAYTTDTASAQGGGNQADSTFATIATYTHEYYSTLMKDDGVTMYSVGTGFTEANYPNCAAILKNIATDENKAYFVASSSDTSTLSDVFSTIASEIKLAATDIKVQDVISDDYSMTFTNPAGVTSTQTGMDSYYIQVVEYVLNPTTKERTGAYTILEIFERSSAGVWTHTVRGTSASDAVSCDNGSANHCSHITLNDDGSVKTITGTHFNTTLNYSAENGQVLNWNTQELHDTELALQYFVYLEGSTGTDKELEAGTYATNKYANVTYENYLGNQCQQTFPVPQLTYNGAQVSYVFYLVNENGEPVNRAGRVVPFAEAVYVTNVETYTTIWSNTDGDSGELKATYLAYDVVPDVYKLYDESAYYEVHVYADAGKADYFIISGSNGLASSTTTKVFNTKAGKRYDAYGAYSETAGTYQDKNGTSYTVSAATAEKMTGFDFANTTVAFAVKWKPELVEDVVVMDFGLPIVVDAGTNDALNGSIVGVRTKAPDAVINSGQIDPTSISSVNVMDSKNNVVGTAEVVSLTSVRFTPTTVITEPVTFYYEYTATYYVEENGNDVLTTATMYSSVTIVPASNVLYEEGFLTAETTGDYVDWTDNSNKGSGTQSSANVACYGFDTAYAYSTGLAGGGSFKSGTLAAPTSELLTESMTKLLTTSFYGTGFDLIGTCGKDTGLLWLVITNEDKSYGKVLAIDTEFRNAGTPELSEATLYQVPLAHVMLGDTNDSYTVTVYGYNHGNTDKGHIVGGEWVEIDGFRVYRETDDTVAETYYVTEEQKLTYVNVKNAVENAQFKPIAYLDTTDDMTGRKFIEVVEKKEHYIYEELGGPQNEIYILPGQSIALKTDSIWVQASLRSVTGSEVSVTFTQSASETKTFTIVHATELYYALDQSSGILTITNNSTSNLLAVCNLKLAPVETNDDSEDEPVEDGTSTVALAEITDEDVQAATYMLARNQAAKTVQEQPAEVFTTTSTMYEEEFWPTVFKTDTEKVTIGGQKYIRLTVTTSTDVAQLNINGKVVSADNYGEVLWGLEENYVYTALEAVGEDGAAKFTVIAYNEDGLPSWTHTIIA